jgi:hypothetical protein
MEISAVISLVNLALLISLLITYLRIYISSRAIFTVGLMFFAAMLMLHNAIAVYGYFVMELLYNEALFPYFVAVHAAELVGIAILLRITIS